ncbi:pyrimidine dimer DNA glycosylase/endonuclease V [Moraxella macacae 0408225]|uniref:Pyrimidine dimer DNA glycosylase/endonuclease V n=1 Tax=Moraxella macacae 0408225 TaxID=1230338 RepID=L2F625_9GAMM|nr:pyrimidine dimer DNA glycosylase/endonuclease V [Moraxella macacae]ELA08482.1 pyrimidine dimer DNA glycosylase/endonuclease V [Moraxella macacae 0408225]
MTRINVIDVNELTDQHLFAEYREITRIFTLVNQACKKHPVSAILKKIPPTYRMSTGHVLFFYDKLNFIEQRYFHLRHEVLKRGFNVTLKDDIVAFRTLIDPRFYQDFHPTKTDIAVNIGRLLEKIHAKPNWYKIHGNLINDTNYCQQLQQLSK